MKHSPLRRALALGALSAMAVVAAPAAQAQGSYPSNPITLVVPFAAGSGTDAVARGVATRLGERLKQPVIVDNKAGANYMTGVKGADFSSFAVGVRHAF